MNKAQIKQVMTVIRPAIRALYGMQRLHLIGYKLVAYNTAGDIIGGWFTVGNRTGRIYKVKLVDYTEIDTVYEDKVETDAKID